ncbi:MAG TPA: biotin-dependent carboxyltransferase family protein [Gemmataceae bacterium]|nr:biotin-dependent carboxyltransferase family protein [Gemmataceae bacterium]
MSMRVLEPGLQTLLVDNGRLSSRALGVPVGGAADRWSWTLGNALLGNPPGTPTLEIALAGPALQAENDVGIIVFGAPFHIFTDRQLLKPNCCFTLRGGEVLRVQGCDRGMRAYLCVSGGFGAKEILGSRSALGPLQAGQALECASSSQRHRHLPESALSSIPASFPQTLRFLSGAQSSWFDADALSRQAFTVTPASNRMGIRLEGEPLNRPKREMISEPVCPGTVQVTNEGQCIVLGVDGQTIGGYPKIAQVISADLDFLGQLRPGDSVRFVSVTLDQAEDAYRQRAAQLQEWLVRIGIVLNCSGVWQSPSL